MASMRTMTKSSVLLLFLVSFIFVASARADEMVLSEERPCAEEKKVGETCYWKNEAFGVCIVSENCKKDCIKKGYKLGGKCKGLNRNCYCLRPCATMCE